MASPQAPETAPAVAPDPSRALVIGDDIGIFLAIARSLGRAGIRVDVATCGEDYPGLQSRYVDQVRVLPSYLNAPQDWIATLSELVAREGYKLVFPASDSALDLLAEASGTIARDRLAIANDAALAAFQSKAATRALAEASQVPVARGEMAIAGQAVADRWRECPFPIVIKPSAPFRTGDTEAKGVVRLSHSYAELSSTLTDLKGREVVIEEFFNGEGVGLSVLARNGAVEMAWQHRRLAQTSTTGRSSQRVGEPPDPRLLADAERLARAVQLHGVAMFEFRQNHETGAHVLLEVNPRYWGSLPLALAAGADFPRRHWNMLTGADGGSAEPNPALHLPLSKTSLTGEYDRISQIEGALRSGAALARLMLAAILAPESFDSWTTDDPAPHQTELRQLAQRTRTAVTRRLSR